MALVACLGLRYRRGRRSILRGRYDAWSYTLTSTFILCGRYGTLRGRSGIWRYVAVFCWLWWYITGLRCHRGRRGFLRARYDT